MNVKVEAPAHKVDRIIQVAKDFNLSPRVNKDGDLQINPRFLSAIEQLSRRTLCDITFRYNKPVLLAAGRALAGLPVLVFTDAKQPLTEEVSDGGL